MPPRSRTTAERWLNGERISTAFVESTVNLVVSRRFAKKQQMQWSKQGAHLLLQTRTRTLDGTLRDLSLLLGAAQPLVRGFKLACSNQPPSSPSVGGLLSVEQRAPNLKLAAPGAQRGPERR